MTLVAETPGPSGSLPGHGRARVQAPTRLLRRRGWRRVARLAAIAAIEEFRANGGRVGGPWAGTIREAYGGHRPRRHPRGIRDAPDALGDAHRAGTGLIPIDGGHRRRQP